MRHSASLEAYRFNDASASVYQFIWDGFCDWFIELAKPILQGDDEAAKIETQAAAQWGLQNALKLLHPFMPYVTEELAEIKPADTGAKFLMLEKWPQIPAVNKDADAEINLVIKAITGIRSVRSEMNVPAGSKIPLIISGSNKLTQQRIVRHNDVLIRLARLDTITVQNDFPEGSIQSIVEEAVFAIHLNEVIDVTAETDRLKKEITKVEKNFKNIR